MKKRRFRKRRTSKIIVTLFVAMILVFVQTLPMQALATDEDSNVEPVAIVEETPVVETPSEDSPAEQTPSEDPPAEQTPSEDPPVEQNPSEETPVVETPSEETPVVETPSEETPVVETPSEETPVVETPSEETPVVETPSEETPVVETPSEETPVEQTPSEETPVVETPSEETPVEQTPSEETPVVETPSKETPVEQTPSEETPVVETPSEETPAEEPSVAPPADSSGEPDSLNDISDDSIAILSVDGNSIDNTTEAQNDVIPVEDDDEFDDGELEPVEGSITIVKVDENGNPITSDEAIFNLYYYTVEEVDENGSVVRMYYALDENGGSYFTEDISKAAAIVTEEGTGKVTVRYLVPNIQYYLKEVSSPDGYDLEEKEIEVPPVEPGEDTEIEVPNFKLPDEPTEPTPTEPTPTEPEPTTPAPTEPKPTKPVPTYPTAPGPNPPKTGDNSRVHEFARIAIISFCALVLIYLDFFKEPKTQKVV